MMWMVRRMFVLAIVLAVSCAAVVLIARANPAPDRLQALGFDVCDGEPCFRGIKPGMDWKVAWSKVPDAIERHKFGLHLELPLKIEEAESIYLFPSKDNATVAGIVLDERGGGDGLLPVTAGDVIARFGLPCRTYIQYADSSPGGMYLIYPSIDVSINIRNGGFDDHRQPSEFRLRTDSPVWMIALATEHIYGNCDDLMSEAFGPEFGLWHGFTSPHVYEGLNRRSFEPSAVP